MPPWRSGTILNGFSISFWAEWPPNVNCKGQCAKFAARRPRANARLLVRHKLRFDAVVNPVRVPPFGGIDRNPVEQHREVEMVAAGKARLAALADLLPPTDAFASLHFDGAQVPVERLQSAAVVKEDGVPEDSKEVRQDDCAVVRR